MLHLLRKLTYPLRYPLYFIFFPLSIFYMCLVSILSLYIVRAKNHYWVSRHSIKLISLSNLLFRDISYKIHLDAQASLPVKNTIIIANHQSLWEAAYLTVLGEPCSPVLKKELIEIPLFSALMATQKPIAIDRSLKFKALKKVISESKQRLRDGINILIFPEGTRKKKIDLEAFSKSAAKIAVETQSQIVPMLHNSGNYFLSSFRTKPGRIDLYIGASITPTEDIDETHGLILEWFRNKIQSLPK